MTLDIIDDFNDLVGFAPAWSSFARTIDDLTPFQLPEWLLTWWRHFGSGQLRVLVFRHGDLINGVVPCFLHDWQGLRQITLIGSGISDYVEPAISPESCSAVVEHLRAYLQSGSDWDLCNWQDLSFNTPLRGLASTVTDETECYVLHLQGNFEEYWGARSKSLRQNVRRDRQKAELRAPLNFEVLSRADAEAMEALIQLHAARWRKHGQPGMIDRNSSAGFLDDIARGFEKRDMLRIFVLRFEGQIAAVILGFQHAGTVFNYLTAFDPQFEALGLGRTLLYESIRYSFEQGYRAWDFLRGNEPYKIWWGADPIPKCRVIVTRTAVCNRLSFATHSSAS